MDLTGPQGGQNHYSFGWFVTVVQRSTLKTRNEEGALFERKKGYGSTSTKYGTKRSSRGEQRAHLPIAKKTIVNDPIRVGTDWNSIGAVRKQPRGVDGGLLYRKATYSITVRRHRRL